MRLQNLGYAVTAHRAQGITTDTAHVLVEPTTTRENLYVAMTRGHESNRAHAILDRPDDHATAHPGDNPDATARTVLYGVLQHSGAELSAHETITAEQDRWGSIAQLAAEYETIAAAAQHDRWAALITSSGLTTDQAEAVIDSDAFGALTAELRRAEANHHNMATLLPRLIRARGFADADDIASVIHHRVANATARPASSGRNRQRPRLIAGLVPEAAGPMNPDMQQALTERRRLIETRAEAVLDTALHTHEPWVAALGPIPAAVGSGTSGDAAPWSSPLTVTGTRSPTRTRSAPNPKAQRRRSTEPTHKQLCVHRCNPAWTRAGGRPLGGQCFSMNCRTA